MCGIAGFVGLNDRSKLRKMCNIIEYRGPDDVGYFSDKNVELGNRRLAIIDLSKKGHMPMSNDSGEIWITYNGEVYNFSDIRETLEKKGYRFKSNTDTEVILKAYEEYGENCVKLFNGMFAFAIWDGRKGKKQLFLARDRVGIKPLYYYHDKEKIIFASEIKAILEFGVKREVDLQALSHYLTYSYTPAPFTMLKGIKKLLPGNYLIYKNKKLNIKKYWDFNFKPENRSEDYYVNLLYETLKRSVKRHLVADVPVGHYLSGGIDSSSILALINQVKKENNDENEINTFSVGFNSDEVIDELEYARIAAEKFDTRHHEIIVEEDSIKEFPRILWHMDEPIPNMSLIPLYFMSERTRKYVTVVTTGNAGDELFAGYRQHALIYKARKYYETFSNLFKSNLTSRTFKVLSLIAPTEKSKRYANFAGKFLPSLGDVSKAYRTLVYLDFDQVEKEKLLNGNLKLSNISDHLIEDIFRKKFDLINKLTLIDLKLTLPDQYLLNDDKLTMANSLESRVPFLDNEMLHFTEILPPQFKINGNTQKYIFKKAMSKYLPPEIIKRNKYGFTAPLKKWYNSYLADVANNLLDSPEIVKQGFFRQDYLTSLLRNSKDNTEKINKIILLLTFELWHKIFINNISPKKIKI